MSSKIIHNYIKNQVNTIKYHQFCPFSPKDHLPDTGPEECSNCLYYGMSDEGWLGYCRNCAIYDYSFNRGLPFELGNELTPDECKQIIYNTSTRYSGQGGTEEYLKKYGYLIEKLEKLPLEFLSVYTNTYCIDAIDSRDKYDSSEYYHSKKYYDSEDYDSIDSY